MCMKRKYCYIWRWWIIGCLLLSGTLSNQHYCQAKQKVPGFFALVYFRCGWYMWSKTYGMREILDTIISSFVTKSFLWFLISFRDDRCMTTCFLVLNFSFVFRCEKTCWTVHHVSWWCQFASLYTAKCKLGLLFKLGTYFARKKLRRIFFFLQFFGY